MLSASSGASPGDLVTALGNAGAPAIPELSHALDDPDEAVRRGAVDALIVIARGFARSMARSGRTLWATLTTTFPAGSKRKLKRTATRSVKIVPLLRHSLDDPNPKVRGASAVTLSTILAANGPSYCNSYIDELAKMRSPWTDWKGPSPSDLILDIAKNLKNVDRDKLPQTLNNLCLGPSAKVAIPYLLPLLRDQDGATRFFVLFNLSAMGPAACEAIPDAMRSLKDPDKGVRLKAMAVLGVCGPAAKDAVPRTGCRSEEH